MQKDILAMPNKTFHAIIHQVPHVVHPPKEET